MRGTLLGAVAVYGLALATTLFTATVGAQGGDSRIQRGYRLPPYL